MEPYISFVVVGRNDDYWHNFLYRMQRFVDSLVYLCEKHELPSELIIVEWNPPEDKERLYKALRFANRKFLKIRFIEVPKSVHDKVKGQRKSPLLEFYGKNMAMRRAKGKFVLITNPDIIFSDDIIKYLAKQELKENIYYRADRYDLFVDIPEEIKTSEVEKFCEDNWTFCWSTYWGRYHRGIRVLSDLPRLTARTLMKYTKGHSYLRYHGGAQGDFALITKESWARFRGFPEIDFLGETSVATIVTGNKLKALKERTYHQSHGNPTAGERPLPDMEAYVKDAKKMLKEKKAIIYNNENWGLGEYDLKEKEI